MCREEALEGGCFCGAVRYRLTGPPAHCTNCHRTLCQGTTGAPFVAWFTVASNAFHLLTGEPERFQSSRSGTRLFCARCGTQLAFQSAQSPEEIDVTTVSLDDPAKAAPEDHTFTRSKQPWVRLGDGLPQYPGPRPESA